jgi:hypothetical protein
MSTVGPHVSGPVSSEPADIWRTADVWQTDATSVANDSVPTEWAAGHVTLGAERQVAGKSRPSCRHDVSTPRGALTCVLRGAEVGRAVVAHNPRDGRVEQK